jgi:hypothetical protein
LCDVARRETLFAAVASTQGKTGTAADEAAIQKNRDAGCSARNPNAVMQWWERFTVWNEREDHGI